MASPTLTERLHALPPELYAEIYELTFTPASTVICIDEGYQPPAPLHINLATRSKFAKEYYGANTIFYIKRTSARKWLTSVDQGEVELHCEFRVDEEPFNTGGRQNRDLRDRILESYCRNKAFPNRIELNLIIPMKFEVRYGEPETTGWISVGDLYEYAWGSHWDPDGDPTGWCRRIFGSSSRKCEAG